MNLMKGMSVRIAKFCKLRDIVLVKVSLWKKIYYFVDYAFAYGCYKLGVEEYWNYRFDLLRRAGRRGVYCWWKKE